MLHRSTIINSHVVVKKKKKKNCGTFAVPFFPYTYYYIARSEFNRLGRNNLARITRESAGRFKRSRLIYMSAADDLLSSRIVHSRFLPHAFSHASASARTHRVKSGKRQQYREKFRV